MITRDMNNAYPALDEQKGEKRPQNTPLLLFLTEQGTQEQQEHLSVNELASLIGKQVEQRLLISTASCSYSSNQMGVANKCCDQLSEILIGWLKQGVRRVLLAPWGSRHTTAPFIEITTNALSAASGENVSVTRLPAPSVHVDGVSVRRAFEGFASIQDQLSPLVEQFPGWDRTHTLFSAGDTQIVLLRSLENVWQPPQAPLLDLPTWKALVAALCPEQARSIPIRDLYHWKRDGHILERYLVSLLCAAAEECCKIIS